MATARQERIRRGFVLISFKKGSGALYLDHTDSVIDTGKDFLREKEETGDPWAQIALRFHLGVRRMWRYINLAKHKNLQDLARTGRMTDAFLDALKKHKPAKRMQAAFIRKHDHLLTPADVAREIMGWQDQEQDQEPEPEQEEEQEQGQEQQAAKPKRGRGRSTKPKPKRKPGGQPKRYTGCIKPSAGKKKKKGPNRLGL